MSDANIPTTLPHIEFPEQLPVSARRDDIAAALAKHQVIIVCGETGSGKTTQLPKIALAAGRGTAGRIGMTQPRRIAAKSVAQRIAEETRSRLGGLIGWQVRFTDQVGPDTRVKVMTDGILLAETQSDPQFKAYDTLILDEAHERSLNIDFLLGYLKTLLPKRPELKVILSSATIEADRFSAYFNGAPVIEVSGRTYPVEVRYRGPVERDTGKKLDADAEPDLDAALLAAVDELAMVGPGDILVFLPGEREIRDAQEDLRKHHPPHTEILPLFGRLSVAEQERVFAPHGGRRIVLATNVAETSLTVPGIRYVVDAGQARVKRYSIRNKIEQLKIEKISRASANQRAGRCGRVAAGVCIRLYDEQDYLGRPAYTTPELLRSSLAGVILRMKALRLPDIADFPFLDAPEPKRIRDGKQLLVELGALDDEDRLTDIGRQLARLPVDPRIGRMLVAARDKGCLHEALVIAAYLSVQDPRDRPMEKQEAADQKHRRFADANSDFVSILRLWQHIDEQNAHRKSQKKFRESLSADFISPLRAREWRDVHGQLAVQVKELGWKVNEAPAHAQALNGVASPFEKGGVRYRRVGASSGISKVVENSSAAKSPPTPLCKGGSIASGEATDPYANLTVTSPLYVNLHQALLPGLLGSLGMLVEDGDYLGARETRFRIFPGSGVRKSPKWLMAAEIVETRRVYARGVARIEPEWIEHAAKHLLKISYSDPHWAKKPAHVAASMRATLYGLPVVNGRKVHYGPIDPVLSRELFIRGALVNGEYDSRAPFFVHNQRLLEEIDDLAHRARNARMQVDEHALYTFFDALIPAGIHNGAAFERWRRDIEKANPRALFLERDALVADNAGQAQAYPTHLDLGGMRFELSYRFDPGTEDDGVTLVVPLAALNQVDVRRCDWLVPGLLEEKIVALIKSLPQSIRRAFVPVPEFARSACAAFSAASLAPGLSLQDALGDFLRKTTGQVVPSDAWRPEALSAHLRMHYRVIDEQGHALGEDRDLASLRRQFGGRAEAEVRRSAESYERDEVTAWDFGDLPATVDVGAGKRLIATFPALAETHGGVALKLFDQSRAADAAHRRGVCRLIWLSQPARLKQAEKDLSHQLVGLPAIRPAAQRPGLRRSDPRRTVRGDAPLPAGRPGDTAHDAGVRNRPQPSRGQTRRGAATHGRCRRGLSDPGSRHHPAAGARPDALEGLAGRHARAVRRIDARRFHGAPSARGADAAVALPEGHPDASGQTGRQPGARYPGTARDGRAAEPVPAAPRTQCRAGPRRSRAGRLRLADRGITRFPVRPGVENPRAGVGKAP
ncbi:MAG: ATP-dependent RNA helicase HrpA [Hydrogenophilales bacterium]|nr:ATP-dependent RNA helicase HrpA [Hydrogenophilales bacterium]